MRRDEKKYHLRHQHGVQFRPVRDQQDSAEQCHEFMRKRAVRTERGDQRCTEHPADLLGARHRNVYHTDV